jgi:hypothetical protein
MLVTRGSWRECRRANNRGWHARGPNGAAHVVYPAGRAHRPGEHRALCRPQKWARLRSGSACTNSPENNDAGLIRPGAAKIADDPGQLLLIQ